MSGEGGGSQYPVVYCDSIQALGMHNGNVRVLLTRLDISGKSADVCLELILPQGEIKNIVSALQKVANPR